MRFIFLGWILLGQVLAIAQGTAPPDPVQLVQAQPGNIANAEKVLLLRLRINQWFTA